MADKITMQQLDAAMQFTSYPIKKYLLSNYSTDIVKQSDLDDEYKDYVASMDIALDAGKKIKISIDLVNKDYYFNFNDYEFDEKDKIVNAMVFLRLCLDICAPCYNGRFELPKHFKCNDDNFTYYLDEEHEYRLGFIIDNI